DLVDAVALAVELVQELPDRAALQVDLDEAIVGAHALEGGIQATVLDQRALHQAVELLAVGRDRQAFHAAVRLAPADVGRQLDVAVSRRKVDEELVRQLEGAKARAAIEVEHVNEGTVLVRDEGGLSTAVDADALRIEAQAVRRVGGVEGGGEAGEEVTAVVHE